MANLIIDESIEPFYWAKTEEKAHEIQTTYSIKLIIKEPKLYKPDY